MSYSTASEFLKIFFPTPCLRQVHFIFLGRNVICFGSDIGVDELIALSEALQISGVDK